VTAGTLLEERLMTSDNDCGAEQAEVLKEQYGRQVIRVGGRVLRSAGWWTPAVHELLNHLQDRGFRYSPRVLPTEERSLETLSYISGEAGAIGWARVVDLDGLRQFARLLRRYHDAVKGFRPRAASIWATADRPLGPGEIICHGDFGPWNVVWRKGRPVGILDWDFAGPGRPIDDVAYALEYCAPFRDDDSAMRWLGYSRPPDRRRRIEVFFDGYGGDVPPDIVDQVASRQLLDISRVAQLAVRGVEPQATWVATGLMDELHRRARWTVEHRELFD
jgi:phosphotransferase family enzyme